MKKTISELKSYFEKGDKPTEQEFCNLIESFVHKDDAGAMAMASPQFAIEGIKDLPLTLPRIVSGSDLILTNGTIPVRLWSTEAAIQNTETLRFEDLPDEPSLQNHFFGVMPLTKLIIKELNYLATGITLNSILRQPLEAKQTNVIDLQAAYLKQLYVGNPKDLVDQAVTLTLDVPNYDNNRQLFNCVVQVVDYFGNASNEVFVQFFDEFIGR